MRLPPRLLLVAFAWGNAFAQPADEFVLVEGGSFRNPKSNYHGRTATPNPYLGRVLAIESFYLGRREVTQKAWAEVMGGNPSRFKGDDLPVETVSWYDCIEYCNRRSVRDGLAPCYRVDCDHQDPENRNEIDPIRWRVTIVPGANGYRLPTEAEWEYAASGGRKSRGHTYSGSDDLDQVGWYWTNSGDRPLTGYWSWPVIQQNHNCTKPVGRRAPNELGLYDMSGNVREWCWNWYAEVASIGTGPAGSAAGRVWRGGGWMGGDFCCTISFRAGFEASGKGPDQGFRLCRSE